MVSSNAIRYAAQHLLNVAFPSCSDPHFEVSPHDGCAVVKFGDAVFRIPLFNDGQWNSFLSGTADVAHVRNFDNSCKIPLFFVTGDDFHSGLSDNEITVSSDILTPSFALLSCFEERVSAHFDSHGRSMYDFSLASKYGIIDMPLVDEYAMLLRKAVRELFPGKFNVSPRRPRTVLTHDIDILERFRSFPQAMRSILGRDMLLNRSLKDTVESFRNYRDWRKSRFNDPYVKQILDFIDMSEKNNVEQHLFFKAQKSGESDTTYDISDDFTVKVVQEVCSRGGDVGIHGSYASAVDPQLLAEEKSRLEKVAGRKVSRSRQHYLRARFSERPNSVEVWEEVGISDDYSVGFAERCGFKCGTCHPFPLYNVGEDRPSSVIEHPLVLMDGTLFDYMKLGVQDSVAIAKALKMKAYSVEGDFTVLWHNHTTTRNYRELYETVFLNLLV